MLSRETHGNESRWDEARGSCAKRRSRWAAALWGGTGHSDATVRESLVRLGPSPREDMSVYAGFLRRRLRLIEDQRTRRVVQAALREMADEDAE